MAPAGNAGAGASTPFARIPVVNPVAGGRGTENPYLSYSGLVSIVGEDLGGR